MRKTTKAEREEIAAVMHGRLVEWGCLMYARGLLAARDEDNLLAMSNRQRMEIVDMVKRCAE